MVQSQRIFSLSVLAAVLFSFPAIADTVGLGCGGAGQPPEFYITIDMSAQTVTVPSPLVAGSTETLPAKIGPEQISWEQQYISGRGGQVVQAYTLDRSTGILEMFGKIEAARNSTTVRYICKKQDRVL